MKKISGVLAVLATAGAAVPAFVRLGELPLDARLFTVGFLGLLSVAATAAFLAVNIGNRPAGFGGEPAPRGLPRRILTLAFSALIATALLWVTLSYHNLIVSERTDTLKREQEIEFTAPHTTATEVAIGLPSGAPQTCTPYDPDPSHRPRTILTWWTTADPRIEIEGFTYPERQGLRCRPALRPEQISVRATPTTVQVLWPRTLKRYRLRASLYGGLLWLAAGILLWRRSR